MSVLYGLFVDTAGSILGINKVYKATTFLSTNVSRPNNLIITPTVVREVSRGGGRLCTSW